MKYKITINDIQKKMQDKLIRCGLFKNRSHLTNSCVRKVMWRYKGEDNPLLPIQSRTED